MYSLGTTLRVAFSPNGEYNAPNIRRMTINNENICIQRPNPQSAPKNPNTYPQSKPNRPQPTPYPQNSYPQSKPNRTQPTPWPQNSEQFTTTRAPIKKKRITTTIAPSTTIQVTQKLCTVPTREATQRVSNGERVPDRYYPWHVSIFKRESTASMYICGGSIISKEYILTAAHCLYEHNQPIVNSRLFIRTGSNLRDGGELFRINDKVIHKDYDFSNYKSDIALLQTKNEIKYSRIVGPVCYTATDFKYTNIDAWV